MRLWYGIKYVLPEAESVANYLLVTNYEVVLSNGTIVSANTQSNPDLFWALKGGGNQFGTLVTLMCSVDSDHHRYCHQICH